MSEKIKELLVKEGQVGREAIGLKARDIKKKLELGITTERLGMSLAEKNWCGVIERYDSNRYYVKEEFNSNE